MRCISLTTILFVATGLVNFASAADEVFETKSITYTGGKYDKEVFQYRLMAPAEISPGKTYPLVVFLHGAGERGTDNALQLKYLPEHMGSDAIRKKFPCFLLAPQCRTGEQWVDVPWGNKESSPMAKEPTHQLNTVIAMLEMTLEANPIDEKRIYLTGLSMGGYGSWELAARRPYTFAALAPICGGGDEGTALKLKRVPTWAFHGDKDGAVPVGRSRSMVKALRDAGNEHVKFSELPEVGHNSWSTAYADGSGLLDWLFEQQNK
jgi:predicted peptidase